MLTQDSEPERYYTLEKKPLRVDSFAKWRIKDVGRYYTATSGDERRGEQLLAQRVNEGLRNQIGSRDMHSVVSGERDELMLELRHDLDESMQRDLGVEVIDVRVKQIDLPPEVSAAVFQPHELRAPDRSTAAPCPGCRNLRWVSALMPTVRWS